MGGILYGADDLRALGWSVAVHNDYRQLGQRMTFWLVTHPTGRWLKGEGPTDAKALDQIRDQIRGTCQWCGVVLRSPRTEALDVCSEACRLALEAVR